MEAQAFGAMLQLLEVALIDCAAAFAALSVCRSSLSIAQAVLRSLVHSLTELRADAPVQQLAATVVDLLESYQARKWFEPDGRARKEMVTQVVAVVVARPNRSAAARGALYLLLLKLFLWVPQGHVTRSYLHKGEPSSSYAQLLAAVYASLPALLAMLAHDVVAPEACCASPAASLLLLCLAYDKEGSITQFVLERTALLAALLAAFDQLDLAQLQPAQQGFHQALLLLLTLSRSTFGAMTLLQHSLFGHITHCPLLAALREGSTAVTLGAMTDADKKALREVLRLILQLALSVECSVRSVRAVNVELTAIVLALAPLTSFLFKDRESGEELYLEVLGLYLGVLQVVANNREKVLEMMNGYENVLKNEVVSLLNYISKLEKVCHSVNANVKKGAAFSESKQKDELYLIIVENGVLFMSKMGWKIGDEYLRAFGVKN